ncbi:MAG: undecaprenyldiphospho-muramoylpentapeptide beta-N-acetylglucosaminyltransferase [Ignavibacteria bacterium GWB2_35_12]|nr:MAG: undecaprenyldiphospho-muramoylpentapeptide beta-N-acetylglucosaminyltransferase [Ignavibacteria bacterium GWA2_35_8]OGU38300.1 MAG: undecaprenyldiphospho-muramoylpentapeptide beta-N-acetylglucosaminyltransferase [Ignavibacteria bacterium GWB2_35_12]OGU89604.1 MAG: undecaprenyldiphospho-muramoylpentapeptide beta-N-acetylglucosaminyltransferase [Ignavibacteria bacterium RIFOXYA2_FULL_35_10]OGV20761.1 MAG: undecaprenyldiphospho-muramoylpentapeptide beta-N-acetylglucosaminyltransferase [Igna
MAREKEFRLLVAAGGTGGHLYPALAVLEHIENVSGKKLKAIFVGTSNRIESRVVPQLGYEFYDIPISGFKGLFSLDTLILPFKIARSIGICRKVIKSFEPDVVLCTGAYISYPAGAAAYHENIPLVLMESNVAPGKAINMLSQKADLIITSFEESENFYNENLSGRIVSLGNPVRKNICSLPPKEEARQALGLETHKKTILVFGGSLGAKSINHSVNNILFAIEKEGWQLIWQTGENYVVKGQVSENIKVFKYIDNMSLVYSASDLVVSRSGATTIAEICTAGKPSILVPLPSASNNEQAINANVMEANGASIIMPDEEVESNLYEYICKLIDDGNTLKSMSNSAKSLAKPDAAENSAKKIVELVELMKGKAKSF